MDERRDVLVIGGATYDTTCVLRGNPIMADSNPSTIYGGCGGVGRNIAENMARMGLRTAFMTAVGTDLFSREILTSCDEIGIDRSRSVISEAAGACKYISLIDERGELLMAASDLTLMEALRPADIAAAREYIDSFPFLLVDANNLEEILRAVAEGYPGRIFADAVSIRKAVRLRAVLDRLDTVKVNRSELSSLTGMPADTEEQIRSAASFLLGQGVKHVYVTKGLDGACCFTADSEHSIPAFPADVRNVTGAGDAFTAAVLYGYRKGFCEKDILFLGTAASHIALESGFAVNHELSEQALLGVFEKLKALEETRSITKEKELQ